MLAFLQVCVLFFKKQKSLDFVSLTVKFNFWLDFQRLFLIHNLLIFDFEIFKDYFWRTEMIHVKTVYFHVVRKVTIACAYGVQQIVNFVSLPYCKVVLGWTKKHKNINAQNIWKMRSQWLNIHNKSNQHQSPHSLHFSNHQWFPH